MRPSGSWTSGKGIILPGLQLLSDTVLEKVYIYTDIFLFLAVQKEIYFKGLAHGIMEASKSKFCRLGLQAGDPEKASVAFQV